MLVFMVSAALDEGVCQEKSLLAFSCVAPRPDKELGRKVEKKSQKSPKGMSIIGHLATRQLSPPVPAATSCDALTFLAGHIAHHGRRTCLPATWDCTSRFLIATAAFAANMSMWKECKTAADIKLEVHYIMVFFSLLLWTGRSRTVVSLCPIHRQWTGEVMSKMYTFGKKYKIDVWKVTPCKQTKKDETDEKL